MITICFVDYLNAFKNGINTYINQMLEGLEENPAITVKLILLNSGFTTDISIQKINKIEKYYIPYDISQDHSKDNVQNLLKFLKEEHGEYKKYNFSFQLD